MYNFLSHHTKKCVNATKVRLTKTNKFIFNIEDLQRFYLLNYSIKCQSNICLKRYFHLHKIFNCDFNVIKPLQYSSNYLVWFIPIGIKPMLFVHIIGKVLYTIILQSSSSSRPNSNRLLCSRE